MPQASDELRAQWKAIFNREFPNGWHVANSEAAREGPVHFEFGPIDAGPCQDFLEKKGWKVTQGWCFQPPPGTPHIRVAPLPEDISIALQFLMDEWDYGPIRWGQPA